MGELESEQKSRHRVERADKQRFRKGPGILNRVSELFGMAVAIGRPIRKRSFQISCLPVRRVARGRQEDKDARPSLTVRNLKHGAQSGKAATFALAGIGRTGRRLACRSVRRTTSAI